MAAEGRPDQNPTGRDLRPYFACCSEERRVRGLHDWCSLAHAGLHPARRRSRHLRRKTTPASPLEHRGRLRTSSDGSSVRAGAASRTGREPLRSQRHLFLKTIESLTLYRGDCLVAGPLLPPGRPLMFEGSCSCTERFCWLDPTVPFCAAGPFLLPAEPLMPAPEFCALGAVAGFVPAAAVFG